ncbi:unnamed protein product [Aphanomyces euteiches]|uniref:MOSC domain-containing protein n=1 Tax=Aphanomyces euteiches TaxID=100861 RepID=A0A6G0WAP7_9STRA|nr:hypothetical protein Ae201684_016966 [Aphanomyces euteiches]KAH9073673.1 hypothetical protein Ae201684P_003176 [Aphanomyces euteiches]KAH9158017.1 hypothetical protein AeRB84_000152 [Aphanomyces euteiches]
MRVILAVAGLAAAQASTPDYSSQLHAWLEALNDHPVLNIVFGRPLAFLASLLPIEYAVLVLGTLTLTVTFLVPYIVNSIIARTLSNENTKTREALEQAIQTARLNAESRRPNLYPAKCPVVTPKGVGKVQSYNADRAMYSVDVQGKVVNVTAAQIPSTRVVDLFIYPIKSCGSIRLKTADILKRGLAYDRQWLIVDGKNDFVTQRKQPKMALLQPVLDVNKPESITLTGPGMEPLVVPVTTRGIERNVRVWKDRIDSIDQGDAAAAWIAKFLDNPTYRLVYFKESFRRQCEIEFAPDHETGFADGFPILIVAKESLEAIQSELKRPISIERFRPNIVVSGCPAWADDTWRDFEIGSLRFRNVKPCSRCAIPSVDPKKGVKDDDSLSNIQDVLKSSRNGEDLGFLDKKADEVFFGSNVVCDKLGPIAVGDTVKVLTVMTA